LEVKKGTYYSIYGLKKKVKKENIEL